MKTDRELLESINNTLNAIFGLLVGIAICVLLACIKGISK